MDDKIDLIKNAMINRDDQVVRKVDQFSSKFNLALMEIKSRAIPLGGIQLNFN